MKERDAVVILAILAWLFWPKRSTSVNLFQSCVFPDGSAVDVELGQDCPYDADHGGQSVIQEY